MKTQIRAARLPETKAGHGVQVVYTYTSTNKAEIDLYEELIRQQLGGAFAITIETETEDGPKN